MAYDANVCAYTSSPGKPWEIVCVSGSPFTKSLYSKHRGRGIRVHANDDYVCLEVKGPYALGVFSINRPNRIDPTQVPSDPLEIDGREYATFAREGKCPTKMGLAETTAISRLLKIVQLADSESLQTYEDAVRIYLKASPVDRVVDIIEALIEIIPKETEPELELELGKLPSNFHTLISLISKWAISDDDERAQLLLDSYKSELASLVETVEPYLALIDSYLDSCGKNPLAEACALGTLAECALEARAVLPSG